MSENVKNLSGIQVKGNKLLLKPRQVDTHTKSGIVLVEDTVDRERSADMFGFVVAVGPQCWVKEVEPRCVVGDFVIHARYAGELFTGNDGVKYRLINDRDIIAVKEPTEAELAGLATEVKTNE